MTLTQKILLFTSALVVALVGTTLAFTTRQADRLAQQTLRQALAETSEVWDTFQADRYAKLKLGIRVLGNDPAFKALVENTDEATILDSLRERNLELKADFFIATDPDGVVLARTDRPGAQGEDLSADPVVTRPLEGEESSTLWRQGDRLFHAVSVPMSTGPDLKGVLIAGYALNEALASQIRKLTHSQVAFLTQAPGQPPRVAASSLGPQEGALPAALGSASSPEREPFELGLGPERHLALRVPLRSAGGETLGSVLVLRSLAEEMASFRGFRTSLVGVAGAVMVLALGLAYAAATRITGPVRRLVTLVERARDGSYAGKVAVDTSDEIGVLARAFNNLLADLREKQQMIDYLREGITLLKKGSGVTGDETVVEAPTQPAAASSGAAGPTPGVLFAGRYDIRATLGRGGMGVVYRAYDRQLDEEVALKVVRADVLRDDPGLLERFKQEIKLARRITHRNVLRTHDFGETGGTPYISMEYLEGVTLKDLLRNKGALPLGVGLRVAKQACQGLEAAHHGGVVHRDIKPHNMLILPETGELKIMDFGISRVSEMKGAAAGLTSTGVVMGTPDYMPPEQAQGKTADFRSDIYSLGVVLFEIFTGKLPFDGASAMEVVVAHIQKAPPRPRALNPALPAELETLILRCLEKVPDRRYPRVEDLLSDLGRISSRSEATAA
ncbi:MAG TPA: protein kinase [Vicinamibacteria bacterium]|nr:protein kinase [Vicinamibacteria bacterium]